MKYLLLIALGFCLMACPTTRETQPNSGLKNPVPANVGAEPAEKLLSKMLGDYLLMKQTLETAADTGLLRVWAKEMMVCTDSLSLLAVSLPPPALDSTGIMAMAISDEIRGMLAETDRKGIELSLQLTALQLYGLLRMMQFKEKKVYLFRSVAGEEEANWLDIYPDSKNPFHSGSVVKEKAIDSLQFR